MIHALHRFVAVAIGLVLVLVAVEAWRSYRWYRPAVAGTALALAIYLAQAMVGAANVWSRLAAPATASHLALAILLFAVLSSLAMLTRTALRPATEAAQQTRTSERTPAAGSLPAGRVT
jgi:heme A synthase